MDPGQVADRELMSRLVAQDVQALSLLYDRYASLALGLAVKMLGDRVSAEEILQEAFMRVWQHAATFQDTRGSFAGWLLGIVRHLCLDRLRSRARVETQLRVDGEQDLAEIENVPDPSVDVLESVIDTQRRNVVQAALHSLPPEQRQVIELAYFAGKTRRQIAALLACPEGTVHTRARLGLARLRQELLAAGVSLDE